MYIGQHSLVDFGGAYIRVYREPSSKLGNTQLSSRLDECMRGARRPPHSANAMGCSSFAASGVELARRPIVTGRIEALVCHETAP